MWASGLFFSVVLLAFIFYNADQTLLKKIFNSVSWTVFLASILLLLSEGLFTALRFKLFTPGNPPLTSCLRISALFIVSLIILPARLGEIAVIFLIKNHLNQTTGASIMNVLTQRFIDLIFLGAMLLLFVIANQTLTQNILFYVLVFLIIFLLIISIYKLDVYLTCFSRFFLNNKRILKFSFSRKILRMLLQARIWFRFHLSNKTIFKAIIVSFFKWISNIGGLTLLFYSIKTPLSEAQLLLTSTAYNLLAIVPIQSIGGFGISEAGLTGILVFFGLPIDLSASISILCRLVLISTPFLFFIIVYTYLYLNRNEKIC